MNALVQDRGELLWGVGRREVRPAHVADEESVSGEDGGRPVRLAAIVHQNANAFERMSRSLQEPEAALSELNLVSVLDRDVRELSSRSRAEIDVRSGALGKFAMSGDEVGMHVGLDNVFDLPRLAGRRLKVDIDIALGIDDGCDALRPNHVGCVRQATQIESFNLYRFHALFSWKTAVVYCGCATSRR